MVHGSIRIGCVYLAGVLAGSLGITKLQHILFFLMCNLYKTTFVVVVGTSVFDPDVYLVGASGGVYALLAAHLANVMLNYNNMQYGIVKLAAILIFGKQNHKYISIKDGEDFLLFYWN